LDKAFYVCTICPLSCEVQLDIEPESKEIRKISHNRCPKGKDYAIKEFTSPERTLTTTVAIEGGIHPLIPVRTDRPIPKPLMHDIMKVSARVRVKSPIKMGDIVVENVLDTGANIIASRNM